MMKSSSSFVVDYRESEKEREREKSEEKTLNRQREMCCFSSRLPFLQSVESRNEWNESLVWLVWLGNPRRFVWTETPAGTIKVVQRTTISKHERWQEQTNHSLIRDELRLKSYERRILSRPLPSMKHRIDVARKQRATLLVQASPSRYLSSVRFEWNL